MLYASYLAWYAFSKAYVGYVHSLSHALSGKYNLPHEYTNAIKQMAFYANKEANPLYPVPELWSSRKLVKIYYKIGKIDYNDIYGRYESYVSKKSKHSVVILLKKNVYVVIGLEKDNDTLSLYNGLLEYLDKS